MTGESVLKDKVILVVDDEPDVLDLVEEELQECMVHKAKDFDTAIEYMLSYSYDAVVLDIMGVNGFDLLKQAVSLKFPTVMLTAHAVTEDALKKSIKLGAISFLPKEKLPELREFIKDAVMNKGKSMWKNVFDKMGNYFNKRFGSDWKERDKFFKEFEESLTKKEAK
jgi:DNA-binding response OmpR family regulator